LYSFAVKGDFISLYYGDEFPLMLGVGTVWSLLLLLCNSILDYVIVFSI
jgi:hypothetical protein